MRVSTAYSADKYKDHNEQNESDEQGNLLGDVGLYQWGWDFVLKSSKWIYARRKDEEECKKQYR